MVEIVTEGHPVLRQKAQAVPQSMFGTPELTEIVANMSEALRATLHGVAIAAPQIAQPWRIFVVSGFVIAGNDRNLEDPDMVFINPKIKKRSRKKVHIDSEGCLSVPGVFGSITRSEKILIEAYDMQGKKFERGGSELLAEIFEHETDHLDGILFIDKAQETWEDAERKEKHD